MLSCLITFTSFAPPLKFPRVRCGDGLPTGKILSPGNGNWELFGNVMVGIDSSGRQIGMMRSGPMSAKTLSALECVRISRNGPIKEKSTPFSGMIECPKDTAGSGKDADPPLFGSLRFAGACPARRTGQSPPPHPAVAPPQLEPWPAVQPKQCPAVRMGMRVQVVRSKSQRRSGPPFSPSPIFICWLKSQS